MTSADQEQLREFIFYLERHYLLHGGGWRSQPDGFYPVSLVELIEKQEKHD